MTATPNPRVASLLLALVTSWACETPTAESAGGAVDRSAPKADAIRFFVANSGEDDQSVSVIDHATRSVVASIDVGGQPHGSAPTAAGDRVYVTLESVPEVLAIDTRSHRILWRASIEPNPDPRMPSTRLNEPSLVLEDRLLYVPDVAGQRQVIVDTRRAEMVGQVAMIDPADGTVMTAPHNTYASADGEWVFATSIFSKKIAKINADTRRIVRVYDLAGQPRPAALKDDLKKMYVQFSQLHGFVELDLETGRETARITWPEKRASPDSFTKCHGIGISPDQKQLWANSNIDGEVYAYSLPDLEPLGSVVVGDLPNWLAFTPDSRFVYITTQEEKKPRGKVTVVDTTDLSVVSVIEVGRKPKRIHRVEVRP